MDYRTENQKAADSFDCDLYRLMGTARNKAGRDDDYEKKWKAIEEKLSHARTIVRSMMDINDLHNTQGV